MKWIRNELIFGANGQDKWMDNSALQPTPIILGDIIRVFVGFRDKEGVGRVGYVDVAAENPSKVIGYSKKPCLDIGEAGCFDDNGCVPCAVVRTEDNLLLFYAGYNVGYHVRMTVFGGVAISKDDGLSFKRYSKVPIMERTNNETLFRAVHSVIQEPDEWKVYYGSGSRFIQGKKKTLPVYEVALLRTDNLFELKQEGNIVLHNQGEEYRVGRPNVIKEKGIYKMFFGKGTEKCTYELAYAESKDGINWTRMDEKLNLKLSRSGWDCEMMAYPAFIRYKEKAYLFYNGNNYGFAGFGYAELIEEE